MDKNIFKSIISHAKSYGFIFPSSQIYDGLSSVYDYGQQGIMLKNNIKEYWWKSMVQLHENIIGFDSAIFVHPNTWKASGHINNFNDFLIENKDTNHRYRVDILIENFCKKIQKKVDKELIKAKKEFGSSFNKKEFFYKNMKVKNYIYQIKNIHFHMNNFIINNNLYGIEKLIKKLNISDPITGSKNWTTIRKFHLMFGTNSIQEKCLYLRPETVQGIFINFSNIHKTSRMKIPFGVAQIGKAFRNEIIARQFIFRMREFEQMEMLFFIHPKEEKKWYKYWKHSRLKWHLNLEKDPKKYRFHDHSNLSHYSRSAVDIEFNFPFGFKELEGIHSRTDFDLKNHEKFSGKNLHYFDPFLKEKYIPYVIETSLGLDRMFLALLSSSFENEKIREGKNRIVLKFPPFLSPIKAGIFPLFKKSGLLEIARNIFNDLKLNYSVIYDEKESIGRRYRRQDAIGTPICITVDNKTLKDNCITVRFRDSMKQKRFPINIIKIILEKETGIKNKLKKLCNF